ncbi:MAG TPA: tRNA (adenosine(37)-N6)-threonylcarbamoyltransferase complex dimerization subunit type 1 TsaB [bacterium]|nr:tRNA (adenosine(37)-N6)-threonylcarbamoyltransferase complex dimerization subunit type 1 TsaB [bacterium]
MAEPLRLLAIDTSGRSQGVAALHGEDLLHESLLLKPASHSETLLASIDSALQAAGWRLEDVDVYALTIGPGSFTGLRIGMSTVKGLCARHPKPVAGISTLAALAFPLLENAEYVVPCLDAHCGEVFSGIYSRDEIYPVALEADRAWPVELWLETLGRLSGRKLLVGDAVAAYGNRLAEISDLEWVEEGRYDHVSPAALGQLGLRLFQQGKALTAAELKPEYLRVSEAENRLHRKSEQEGEGP